MLGFGTNTILSNPSFKFKIQHENVIINQFNTKKLKELFLKLNENKALPECLIVDDFYFDNKYLHMSYEKKNANESAITRYLILDYSFVEYQLAFLFLLIIETTEFNIVEIMIDDTDISNFIRKNDLKSLELTLQKELLNLKLKKSKALIISIKFSCTYYASVLAHQSIYFN